jgi:hypothetical protein
VKEKRGSEGLREERVHFLREGSMRVLEGASCES